jgi:predicted RNase H-like HicB family nuclease
MRKYLIVIEVTQTGFSAYSSDLPGCVSTGRTREEVEQNMREAIALHLDGLREEGQAVPEPQTARRRLLNILSHDRFQP